MNQVPAWLNGSFLKTVLQGGEKKEPEVTITDFSAKPAIAAGDNFSSYLFRVKVTYRVGDSSEEQSQSLIVKLPVQSGFIVDLAKHTDFYDKESIFYSKLLPKMNAKLNCEFSPPAYYSPIDRVIVQKDMAPDYKVGHKFDQLNFNHAKLVYTTLAKFHASAIAIHHDDPKLVESVRGETLYPEGSALQGWIEVATKTVGEVLSTIDGCKQHADFFLSRVDTIWDSAVEGVKAKYRVNCQLHGDSWTNNLMFKHNPDNEPVDVKIIDYQISRYSTPALDVMYFLYTSCNPDARKRYRELFEIYLKTFNDSLEQLGCQERMTYEQLIDDFKTATPFFITTVVFGITPIMSSGTSDGESYEEFTAEDIRSGKASPVVVKMCHGENLRVVLPEVINHYFNVISA